MSAANVTVGADTARPGFILELRGITAGYGRTTVLRDIDLVVRTATVVALLGPNGAGKSTLLRVAAGLLQPTKGMVRVGPDDVTKKSPNERVRAGLCLIPDGRGIFPSLTVKENLSLALPAWEKTRSFDPALDVFPMLKRRLRQKAGTLSGGEQRMLALARCHLANPSIVLLDEVSTGLAPHMIDHIFESFTRLIRNGVAVLLVEQYVDRALKMADTAYLLSQGIITFSGPSAELDKGAVLQGYLGGGPRPPNSVVRSDEGSARGHTRPTEEEPHQSNLRSTQEEEK